MALSTALEGVPKSISPVNGNKIWNADLPAVGAGVALAKNGTLYFAGGDYDHEGCGEPGWIMSVLTNGTYVNDIEQLGCHGIPSSPLVGSRRDCLRRNHFTLHTRVISRLLF